MTTIVHLTVTVQGDPTEFNKTAYAQILLSALNITGAHVEVEIILLNAKRAGIEYFYSEYLFLEYLLSILVQNFQVVSVITYNTTALQQQSNISATVQGAANFTIQELQRTTNVAFTFLNSEVNVTVVVPSTSPPLSMTTTTARATTTTAPPTSTTTTPSLSSTTQASEVCALITLLFFDSIK